MIRVLIEVDSGACRFGLEVRAESIVRALSIAEALYPGTDARVVFPIEPEEFFVEDPAAAPRRLCSEMAQAVVG